VQVTWYHDVDWRLWPTRLITKATEISCIGAHPGPPIWSPRDSSVTTGRLRVVPRDDTVADGGPARTG